MNKLQPCVDCSSPSQSAPLSRSVTLPARYAPMLFGLILSGLMSLLVSGIATFRAAGVTADFTALWMRGWLTAWLFAFPVVLVVAPVARKAVQQLVAKG